MTLRKAYIVTTYGEVDYLNMFTQMLTVDGTEI